ncbi:hypothetical protein F5Y17DRAFT_413864 [Xylariaceae sp. FL0594]|nr:hypothetical protein F5Y17DRAFT_413864 [Xylariaceae sp. FL0594]
MDQQLEVEILVHIQAPSRALDDARYRSLAAAYLAFQPAVSEHFLSESEHGHGLGSGRSVPVHGQGPRTQVFNFHPKGPDDCEPNIVLSDDKLGSFRSVQASFNSVFDNACSPQLRMRQYGGIESAAPQQIPLRATQPSQATQATQATQPYSDAPPGSVQDSQVIEHPALGSFTSSPTMVLENYLQQHFQSLSESSRHGSQTSPLAVAVSQHFQGAGQHQIRPREMLPCPPYIIPCSLGDRGRTKLPTGSMDEAGRQIRSQTEQRQQLHLEGSISDESGSDHIIEETTLLSSLQSLSEERSDGEPPFKRRQTYSLATSSGGLAGTTGVIGPSSLSQSRVPVSFKFLTTHGYTYESLEIRPPEPATSDLDIKPGQLITRDLRKLGSDVDVSLHFRPRQQTRELRPFERGCWLLDCSSWEPQLKRAAWACLANYIGMGKAGWGVWCKRDPGFTELRAYCWGAVAAHVYYVLKMSSQGEVKLTGSSWIDGEGSAVIIMGPAERTQT